MDTIDTVNAELATLETTGMDTETMAADMELISLQSALDAHTGDASETTIDWNGF